MATSFHIKMKMKQVLNGAIIQSGSETYRNETSSTSSKDALKK